MSNVTVRGVSLQFDKLHPQIKMKEGRIFNPSLRELIVGDAVTSKYAELKSGVKLNLQVIIGR
jgi:hypothetical protein